MGRPSSLLGNPAFGSGFSAGSENGSSEGLGLGIAAAKETSAPCAPDFGRIRVGITRSHGNCT
jgi:hypothetical protein